MSAAVLWKKYVTWLERRVPRAYGNLAEPASSAQIAKLERAMSCSLPESVKAVWQINNGQKQTMTATSCNDAIVCIPTLSFLSTEETLSIWRQWDKLRRTEKRLKDLQAMGTSPEKGVIRSLYTHPGWIPLWCDPTAADYIGLDLAPGRKGKKGQIISFGRDETEHRCFASSFEGLLEILLEEVTSGNWPATKRTGENGKKLPWFGDPNDNFFNTLYARWKARMPPDPAALAAEAERKDKQAHMALVTKAEKAIEARRYARAEKLLLEARGVGRENGLCSSLLAEVYTKKKRYREAEEAWAIATDRAPLAEEFWEARCDNLVENLKALEEADAVASVALGSHPYNEALIEVRILAAAEREDFATMAAYCKQYLELDPDFTPGRVNYAWALAATGKIAQAIAQSKKAFEAADDDEADVAVEAAFFLYALSDRTAQSTWLERLRALLDGGARSTDWNFKPIIAAATRRKHPAKAWLARLADVANDIADRDELASWPAWTAAAPKGARRLRRPGKGKAQ